MNTSNKNITQINTADADGWIDWAGGKIPVDKKALVDLKFRDSVEYKEVDAGDFYWPHTNSLSDIIAYRMHQPQDANNIVSNGISIHHVHSAVNAEITSAPDANSRANDDRLESDLNECIGQPQVNEWDGHGLPPVGVEFEYGEHQMRAKCLGVGLHYVFASKGDPNDEDGEYEEFMITHDTNFSPVDSGREKAIEEIMAVTGLRSRDGGGVVARRIYNAGYRKQ